MTTAKLLTYGVLPSDEELREAFERECPQGYYVVKAGLGGLFAGTDYDLSYAERDTLTLAHLRDLLEQLVAIWRGEGETCFASEEDAGDEASSILSTLGFEWV